MKLLYSIASESYKVVAFGRIIARIRSRDNAGKVIPFKEIQSRGIRLAQRYAAISQERAQS